MREGERNSERVALVVCVTINCVPRFAFLVCMYVLCVRCAY